MSSGEKREAAEILQTMLLRLADDASTEPAVHETDPADLC